MASINGGLRRIGDLVSELASSRLAHTVESATVIVKTTIARVLLDADVPPRLVGSFAKHALDDLVSGGSTGATTTYRGKQIVASVAKGLCLMLQPPSPSPAKPFAPRNGKCHVVLFLGLQGNGKTTTIMKYALFSKKQTPGLRVLTVGADTVRAGALDQLQQNCKKIGVPCYGSHMMLDSEAIVETALATHRDTGDYDLILIDTAGRNYQATDSMGELVRVAAMARADRCILVMDATSGHTVYDHAMKFHAHVPVHEIILSKMDGSGKGGGALAAAAQASIPISFIGTGESPTALEPFHATRFISRLLGMGDLNRLGELLKHADGGALTDATAKLFVKGAEFTFRDLYGQLELLRKMGPLKEIVALLPRHLLDKFTGRKQALAPASVAACADDVSANAEQVFKTMLTIMDSMAPCELDSDSAFLKKSPSRMERIARGAGVDLDRIVVLCEMFNSLRKSIGVLQDGMASSRPSAARSSSSPPSSFPPSSPSSSAAPSAKEKLLRAKTRAGRAGRVGRTDGLMELASGIQSEDDLQHVLQKLTGGRGSRGVGAGGVALQRLMKGLF